MEKQYTDIQVASLITALKVKGETPEEISGFASAMRQKAEKVYVEDPVVLDTCGTGGDGQNTFNISTTVALVAAAAGVCVAKHGNRKVSSASGSADVLENLGIVIPDSPRVAERILNQEKLSFLFAPHFHKAMKYVKEVRADLGMRTVFNLLGPLTNPAGANYQLLGVYSAELTEPLAKVLRDLGGKRAMVVSGLCGSDEISLTQPTNVSELIDGDVINYQINPEAFGFQLVDHRYLQGGTPLENARITLDILQGARGPKRDITLLNAGAALYLAGAADNISDGIELAKFVIDEGKAIAKLEGFRDASKISQAG